MATRAVIFVSLHVRFRLLGMPCVSKSRLAQAYAMFWETCVFVANGCASGTLGDVL